MKLKHRVNRKGKRAVHKKNRHGRWSTSMVKTSKFNSHSELQFKYPSPWLATEGG